MICRIFYTNKNGAKQHSLPPVGTKYEINTLEALRSLAKEVACELIFDNNLLPRFVYDLHYVWRKNWLEHIVDDYENVIEEEYLVEYPTKDWLTCQWIEVYNGYRE